MSLKGKVAIVTGAGSGIGRACAIRLARDGADVAVWDINPTSAKETAIIAGSDGHEDAGYVTGQTLSVNGGRDLQ
jgi:NAD(P)-dependent dehydrogenase (short-subunit alcohol dehydrogenase family)